MQDILFDTKEKRTFATLAFGNLLSDPGWGIVVSVIDANITNLTEQLKDPESEDTIEEIKMKRRLIRFYNSIKNLPQDKIKEFSGVGEAGVDPQLDPFDRPPVTSVPPVAR